MSEIQAQMSQMEYENFVSMVQNFTEEQKWVAIRSIPSEMLWQDLYSRFNEQSHTLENIKNAAKA